MNFLLSSLFIWFVSSGYVAAAELLTDKQARAKAADIY